MSSPLPTLVSYFFCGVWILWLTSFQVFKTFLSCSTVGVKHTNNSLQLNNHFRLPKTNSIPYLPNTDLSPEPHYNFYSTAWTLNQANNDNRIWHWWHYPLQIYSILNNVYIKKRLMCIHMRFQRKINYQVCLPTLLLELLQPPPVINPFSADFFEPPSETHWPLRWIKIEYITLVCRKSFL